MIDALEAVIVHLLTDADLNVLTNARVAAKHKFGDGWTIPSKAVQIRYDGGLPDLDVQWQQPRLEARCYGENQVEAGRVYRELVRITRNTQRARAETGDGYGLIYWLLPTSGPSLIVDPDTNTDAVLFFLKAAVSEVDIP